MPAHVANAPVVTGTIHLRDLTITATHGVNAAEQQTPQRFRVSVELTVDVARAAVGDRLEDTVDWSQIRDSVQRSVTMHRFSLVERLARQVGVDLLDLDGRIEHVAVTVEKLDAFADGVPGVTLRLNRSEA